MRQKIKDFTEIVSKTLPIIEPIYEFGSLQVPEQVGFADLRPFFPSKEYVGCDMRKGPGVDRILNLHSIDLPSESVGTVLCFDTLEHVERPSIALEEIYRIIKPGGIVAISSVMKFPIHDHPNDYWRFTPEAFRSILKPFAHSIVGSLGDEIFPHTVVGVGFKGDLPSLVEFNVMFTDWQKEVKIPLADNSPLIKRIILMITPPIMLPIIKKPYLFIASHFKK
jgi:SAM-dependent methyltransferase